MRRCSRKFPPQDTRFIEIAHAFLNPRTPTPLTVDAPAAVEFMAGEAVDEVVDQPVGGLPPSIAPTSSFQFVQDDELEAETQEEALQELVEELEEQAQPDVEVIEITETVAEMNINGHRVVEDTVTLTTTEV